MSDAATAADEDLPPADAVAATASHQHYST